MHYHTRLSWAQIVTCRLAPSHYLNQYWLFIKFIFDDILQGNLNQNKQISLQKMSLNMSQAKRQHFVSASMCSTTCSYIPSWRVHCVINACHMHVVFIVRVTSHLAISNHRQQGFLSTDVGLTIKKTSKLRSIAEPSWAKSVTVDDSPSKGPMMWKAFPCIYVITTK